MPSTSTVQQPHRPCAAALARAEQIELLLQQLDQVVMRLDLGATPARR